MLEVIDGDTRLEDGSALTVARHLASDIRFAQDEEAAIKRLAAMKAAIPKIASEVQPVAPAHFSYSPGPNELVLDTTYGGEKLPDTALANAQTEPARPLAASELALGVHEPRNLSAPTDSAEARPVHAEVAPVNAELTGLANYINFSKTAWSKLSRGKNTGRVIPFCDKIVGEIEALATNFNGLNALGKEEALLKFKEKFFLLIADPEEGLAYADGRRYSSYVKNLAAHVNKTVAGLLPDVPEELGLNGHRDRIRREISAAMPRQLALP